MRFRSFLRWVIVVVVLCGGGYMAADIGWNYYTVQELVDKALRDASARHRAAFMTGSQIAVDSLAGFARSAILLAALHEGVRMEEKNVSVSANAAGFSATARWSYPVISYQGTDVLVVPMSVRRSLIVAP